MNKQSFITILLTVFMSMTGAKAFAHDIEVKNADGVTIYYVWTSNNTELAVSCRGEHSSDYINEYTGNVVIPESVEYNGKIYPVTSIDRGAFYNCPDLTSVTIPNSVTSIGSHAFNYCSGLTSINIPNSVTYIGSEAFERTQWYFLQPEGLVYAGKFAYEYKGTMPDNTEIEIKDGTLGIVARAFAGCSGLTSVTIPNSVKYIGSGAFDETAWYNNQPNGLVYAGKFAYKHKGTMPNNTEVEIKDGTVGIVDGAFSGCSGLTSVTIPNSVTDIGSYAFSDCSGLTSVTTPNSVTSIGGSAFAGCSGLTSFTIGNSVTSIGEKAFYNCNSLISLTIPKSVTSIGEYAFAESGFSTIFSEVETPFEVKHLVVTPVIFIVPVGTKAAYQSAGWSLDPHYYIEAGEGGLVIGGFIYIRFVIDGICYRISENNTALLTSANKSISGAVIIPSQVEFNGKTYDVDGIDPQAFSNCTGLTSVTIPNSVTNIGKEAFSGCSGLTSVTIPKSVTSIGDDAFYGCSGLTSVTISNNVTSIGDDAFYGCSGLTSVTIPNSVESISDNAFYGCSGLTSVTIPNSVTSIGNWAFSGCSSLKYITFGSNLESIGQEAFSDCTALEEITSKAQTPPVCGPQALEDINKGECKLYVPDGSLAAYEKADQWKDFLSKEEGEGTQPQEPVVGDVNSDGKMDKNDLRDLVEYIMGNKPNGVTFESADVNGDNKVNVADVVALTTLLK